MLRPRLVESLSRIPQLKRVEATGVGVSIPAKLEHAIPRPLPLSVLHLEYHAGSALWYALPRLPWFRCQPATALAIRVISVTDPHVAIRELFDVVSWSTGFNVEMQCSGADPEDFDLVQLDPKQPFCIDIGVSSSIASSELICKVLALTIGIFKLHSKKKLVANIYQIGNEGEDEIIWPAAYALPAYADGGALFYRVDLLNKYGIWSPPTTWNEMEAMLVRILAGERATNPSLAGFVTQLRPYEGLTCNVVEWLAGANLTMYLDSSMNLTLATKTEQDQAAKVLSRFRRWIVAGLIPTASLLYSDADLSWGVAPLPGESADLVGASTLGGGMIAVNRFASNVTRAALAAEFLSGPEVQRLMTTGLGFRPTIPALFRDPDVNRVYDAGFLNSTQITNRPAASSKDHYLAVSTIIYTGVNLILGGFADTLATTASINTAIAKLLDIDHFGPPQVVVWNDSDAISAMTLVSLLVLVISALAVYLLHSRDAARKRRLPTEFLVGVLVGSLVGSLTPLAHIGTPTAISCQLRVILLGMGFIVMASCMAAQDFRVYLIISSPLRRVASDVNRIMWQSLVAVWVLEAILLGVWLGLDPLVPVDVIVSDAWRYTGCASKNRTFSSGMFGMQCLLCVLLVLLCVWLAVHNRGVSKTNTSGGAMSRASYLLAICSSSAIGALSILNLAPGPYLLSMTVTIALCVLSVLWAYVLGQLTAPPAVEDSSWMGTTIHAASDSVDDAGAPNDLSVAPQSTRAVETKSLTIRFGHTERALHLSPWMAGARVVLVPDAGILIVRYSQRPLVLSLRKLASVSPYEPKTHSFTATFAAGILEVHARSESVLVEWHARLNQAVPGSVSLRPVDLGPPRPRRRLHPRARVQPRLKLADLPLDVFRAIVENLLAEDANFRAVGCLSVDADIVPTILALRRTCKTWQRVVDEKLFWHINVKILVKPGDDDSDGDDSISASESDSDDSASNPDSDDEMEEDSDDESDIFMRIVAEVERNGRGASRPPSSFGVVKDADWFWIAVRAERGAARQADGDGSRRGFAFGDPYSDENDDNDEDALVPTVLPDIARPHNVPHLGRVRSLGIMLPAVLDEPEEFGGQYEGLGPLLTHLVGQFPHLSALAVAGKPLPGRVIAPALALRIGTLDHLWIGVLDGWKDVVAQYLHQMHHQVVQNVDGDGRQLVLALPQLSTLHLLVKEAIDAVDLVRLAGTLRDLQIRSRANPIMVSSTTLARACWPVLQSVDVPVVIFDHLFHCAATDVNPDLVLPKVHTLQLHGRDDPDRCVWHNAVRAGSLVPAPPLPLLPQLVCAHFTDVALSNELLVHLSNLSPLLAALKMAHCTLTRLGPNLATTFSSLVCLELTRSTTVWNHLVETASAPQLAELVLHDDAVKALSVPWKTVTSLDVMLEGIEFPFAGVRLDATVLDSLHGLTKLTLHQPTTWSFNIFPSLSGLTHLTAEQGNVSQLVTHCAFSHLTHVDLRNNTRGSMVEKLPATVRSVKATVLHPRLVECLSRIPNLDLVDAEYVGASCPSPFVFMMPHPEPLDLLHLEYHAGSALWPALLQMGWFRNRPAKALRLNVMHVGDEMVTCLMLLGAVVWVRGHAVKVALVEGDVRDDTEADSFRVDINFMPGVDDSAKPRLTLALADFKMNNDKMVFGSIRTVGADESDGIAADVGELVLMSDEDEISGAEKDVSGEDAMEE
ncbi:hypothetical protein GGF32_001420 [Allomyces javanicus]|nr:hypothetical protein GGF32_001420 [Allomyces javanicus]